MVDFYSVLIYYSSLDLGVFRHLIYYTRSVQGQFKKSKKHLIICITLKVSSFVADEEYFLINENHSESDMGDPPYTSFFTSFYRVYLSC